MCYRILIRIIVFIFAIKSFSQEKTIVKDTISFNNTISITNNGISLIPTFSLGKPATIIELSVRKKRFSFDPQLRFALKDAKPWSFVFWMRYKCIDTKKFKLGIGAHPSFVFQTTPAIVNGIQKDLITTKRFFASEFVPTYIVNKKVSFGLYYLYSRGLDLGLKNTHFICANGYFSNIKLYSDFNLKFVPQFYYLRLDSKSGFYTASTITLVKQKFPISISSTINKKINSTIASENLVWNVSLNYSFGGKYVAN